MTGVLSRLGRRAELGFALALLVALDVVAGHLALGFDPRFVH